MYTQTALFPEGQPRPTYRIGPKYALLGLGIIHGQVDVYMNRVDDPIRYLRELASAASAAAAELESARRLEVLVR